MPRPRVSQAIIEAIQGASLDERSDSVGARLGISGRTVRQYRREMREQRQEAAREALAAHVQETVPDVLADLSEIRTLAGARYRESGDARQGNLWPAAIKTTLEHVSPSDAELDRAVEWELERLVAARTNGDG
jgi:hypothetical protein